MDNVFQEMIEAGRWTHLMVAVYSTGERHSWALVRREPDQSLEEATDWGYWFYEPVGLAHRG